MTTVTETEDDVLSPEARPAIELPNFRLMRQCPKCLRDDWTMHYFVAYDDSDDADLPMGTKWTIMNRGIGSSVTVRYLPKTISGIILHLCPCSYYEITKTADDSAPVSSDSNDRRYEVTPIDIDAIAAEEKRDRDALRFTMIAHLLTTKMAGVYTHFKEQALTLSPEARMSDSLREIVDKLIYEFQWENRPHD